MATDRSAKATPRKAPATRDAAVNTVFQSYPPALRAKLLALRGLILDTAKTTAGVGALEETLKWGQPSYLTTSTKSGSTIRIDRVKSSGDRYAVYFHCQTDLVATFRELYPNEMTYDGNRAIVFGIHDRLPEGALRHCIGLTLTYHLKNRKSARSM
ncbi:MAG: DUF1801 domain-containing protein [Proteobacteria bacterium]|nr:DUF1801 domain-containing protein [Pseudomonadota bacterium]